MGPWQDGSKRLPRDIKSGHCDPRRACLEDFSSVLDSFLVSERIHCVLKCLGGPLTGLKHCGLKRDGVLDCWKRNHGRGEGVKQYFLCIVPKAIRMHERSQGPPCRMEACVARQILKIFMDSFKPLFCCVDGCIFCSEKVSCCPWTGWRLVSRDMHVGKPFHCVRDLNTALLS
ncbi:hypothetical protein TNCT_404451 [Trichonephila clavata]|uniref:Uncharacterized protein n=1 Tax=Trichonephila clavata TaxID=2740835 RepID=A0A8X6HC11_TRICU|nr:hypothetical protein TNCT_404451 [Trichonephila clavata]